MKHIICTIAAMFTVAMAAHAQYDHIGNFNFRKVLATSVLMETVTMTCEALIRQPLPSSYIGETEKVASWNTQTLWLTNVRTQVDGWLASARETLRDSVVTTKEATLLRDARAKISFTNPDAGSYAGPLLKRQQDASAIFQALVMNE